MQRSSSRDHVVLIKLSREKVKPSFWYESYWYSLARLMLHRDKFHSGWQYRNARRLSPLDTVFSQLAERARANS